MSFIERKGLNLAEDNFPKPVFGNEVVSDIRCLQEIVKVSDLVYQSLSDFNKVPNLLDSVILPTYKLVDQKSIDELNTLVHLAIRLNNLPMLKLSLVLKPDLLNVKNALGYSPLLYAAYHGRTDMVELLVDPSSLDIIEKADLSATVINGRGALHLACSSGYLSTAKKLIAFGLSMNATDKEGKTPLDAAKGTIKAYDVVKELSMTKEMNELIFNLKVLIAELSPPRPS